MCMYMHMYAYACVGRVYDCMCGLERSLPRQRHRTAQFELSSTNIPKDKRPLTYY